MKVFQGECIPPLLKLLKFGTAEAQKEAAKEIYALSVGGVADQVLMDIFVTKGLVLNLWNQLHSKQKIVDDLLRALKKTFSIKKHSKLAEQISFLVVVQWLNQMHLTSWLV